MTEGHDGRESLVPVATISELNLQIMPADSNTQLLRQDKMYTSAYRYDKEKEQLSVISEGWRSECFTADLQGNYYILEGLNEGQGNFLRLSKYNQHQELIFQKDYPDTAISIRDGVDISCIVASEEGNLCFYSADGLLIFCDEHGDIKNYQMLDATGVEGIALGPQEKAVAFSWGEENIELYQINLKDGTIKEGGPCASYPSTGFYPETCVYSGYDEGIFITTREGLWRYQPESNENSLLFKWNESRLNLNGNMVRGFSRLENGNYFALLWNSPGLEGEQVEIALLEESTLPERKVITLGIPRDNYVATEKYIKQFNRQSQEWEVKPVRYGEPDSFGQDAVLDGVTQLNLALADGNGPDLIDLSHISAEGMAANGYLEDLEGYFQNSQTLSREDILEQIWQAGMVNGKITGIIPCFSISTLISRNPEQQAGRTVEEAFSMSKGNDWDYLLEYMKPIQLYSLIVNENRDYFVDYQERKSYFNSEEFISLLEQLQKTEFCQEIPPAYQSGADGEQEREFMKGNYLLQQASFKNLEDYMRISRQYNNQISWAGYPSMNGEPVHHLSISCMIGMNSSSQYKEGAWAFLLSDAVQNQKTADDLGKFPVRKDAFENYLVNDSYWQPGDRISSRYGQPEESDIQAVRDMIENGVYQHSYNFNDPIDMILTEEGYGFLEGDFSAEETANKIHSRVQLYLDEM